MKINNTLTSLGCLIRRNIGIYLKDKMMVFFSVLTPVIVLLLYILFLGDMQADMVVGMLEEKGILAELKQTIGEAEINSIVHGIINNWMIAGVLGVSCITVALNASTMMVRDRERGNVNDVLSAPVKRWVLYASYIISVFVITFSICFAIFLLSIIYLACSGGLMMNFIDFLGIFGVTILAVLSSSFLVVLIISFIKTEGTLCALNGFFSAGIGFLIGAYLPFSMLPNGIQYIACFIPGTYGAGLFRSLFMRGPIDKLSNILQASNIDMSIIEDIVKDYSIEMDFFGHTISAGWMVLALAIFLLLTAALLLIFYSNKRTNFFQFASKAKKKKNKKK